MLNTAFSVAFEAPSWNDPDFFAMNYFKRIIGEYRCDKFTGDHLNSPHLQYNSFHTYLGNNPDLILHKPFYFAYSDTGLFGNFIYGNEMYSQEMSVITQNQMSVYAQYVPDSSRRSINPRSSEPGISTSMTCWSSMSQLMFLWQMLSNWPTSTAWSAELRLLPVFLIWLLLTCQRWQLDGSGIRRLQWLDGEICTQPSSMLTTIEPSREPLWESTLRLASISSIDHLPQII